MPIEYRWKVLALVVFMQALIIGSGVYCFGFFVIHWMKEFSSQRTELMIAYTSMTLISGILAPFAGNWINTYSRRLLIVIGTISFSIGLAIMSQASGPGIIVGVVTLMFPLGMALSGPLMSQTLIAHVFHENRGLALGICALGTSIGGFTMPILVTYLLELYDWRQVLLLLSFIITFTIIPIAMLLLKHLPKDKNTQSKTHKHVSSKELLRDPDVYKLSIAYLVPSALFVGVLQNIGLHATDITISQQQAGMIVSVAAALMAAGKLLTGALADRINHALLYYCMLAMVAMGTYLTAASTAFLSLIIGVALLGTAAGGISPLISAVTVHRYGSGNFSRAMGLIMSSTSLAGFSPLIAGWLRDISGSYYMAFLLMLPLLIPAIIAFSRLSLYVADTQPEETHIQE